MGFSATLRRRADVIQWVSLGLIVLSLFLIARTLPFDQLMAGLRGWIAGAGVWGPLIFGGLYVVATVLFLPGSVLTLAAGAIFGLWLGTLIVSLASTTGAALAFLIARYLARDRVEAAARRRPRFAAVDQAIAEGGWKIVLLLRLSPAIPFNLQNYLYGLTPIRFWPCVLTSWAAMLPGTFLYVYLGHVAGLVVGEERERSPAEWAALAVGLAATVAVTWYVTRLARQKLEEQTMVEKQVEQQVEEGKGSERKAAATPDSEGWPWGAVVTALVAVAALGGAVWAQLNPSALGSAVSALLGPPAVQLEESYEAQPGGPHVDHASWNSVLEKHLEEGGWLDYAALAASPVDLDRYLETVAAAPFDDLGRDEKLALLINAYNAFTVRLILDYYPVDSIRDIPEGERWEKVRWQVGEHSWSLDQIEHEQIRPHFAEPRIHFALVCAAVGCPPLRSSAYRPDRIEEQLAEQTRYVHAHADWFRFEPADNTVYLTEIYNWYGGDFEQAAGSVLAFAARYAPELEQALAAGKEPAIKWLPYDWGLNDTKRQRPR